MTSISRFLLLAASARASISRFLLLSALLCLAHLPLAAQEQAPAVRCRIAFWNVENLFDTQHDTLKEDFEFTPRGDKHWNAKRLSAKTNLISKTLMALGEEADSGEAIGNDEAELMPILVGLAEVENDRVLRDLCRSTALRRYDYRFMHFESPDRRGIDVALLYRPDRFAVCSARAIGVSDSAADFFTRDLLMVRGVTREGDSLTLFVCHFPSKRGGAAAEEHRARIAARLRLLMDSAAARHPSSTVLAMGDFNSAPDEPCLVQGLGLTAGAAAPPFVNLMSGLPAGQGSYCYRGDWSYIDQFLISAGALTRGDAAALHVEDGVAHVFRHWALLSSDPRRLDSRPRATYQGPRYLGGASDHLPIFLTLSR